MKALKAARDVFADRHSRRSCVARFKRTNDVLMFAHELLNIAWPAAVGRTGNLLVVSETTISLRKRRVVRKRDQFDMKAFVQRDEVAERLERRAIRSRGDQAIDGLEMIKRSAVTVFDRERRGARFDYEPRLEELAKLVVSWAQRNAVALVTLEGDKTLGMKTRQGFTHWNKACAQDFRELVDDDAFAVGEPAICDQPMQFVVREIDEASERGRRISASIGPGEANLALLRNTQV